MTRCSGKIGTISFSGPLLKVRVFADRLTVRPILMGEHTILGSEIRSLNAEEGFWSGGARVVIEHVVPDVRSPITLFLAPANHVRHAIEQIRRDPPRGIAAPVAPAPTGPSSPGPRHRC